MSENHSLPVLLSIFFAKKYNKQQDISVILAQTYLGLSRNGMKIREDRLNAGSAYYSFDNRFDAELMMAMVRERTGSLPHGRKYLETLQYRIRTHAPATEKRLETRLETAIDSSPEPISLKDGSFSGQIGE